ncbi:MAG TPA: chromosomal replication initiator protein DnaA [Solirubrobacterales bacterium]|nr:chromosomal replication initiator protein DnaA [Solirubrobacterales bacterium]
MEQALPEDLAAIWQRVGDEIRASLPPSTYKLWLEPLRVVSARGTTLYVTGPKRVRTWVERRYAHRLDEAVQRHTNSLREVAFVSAEERDDRNAERAGRSRAERPNPGHTFERFVIGSGNRLAHGAALAVAELPGDAYNPLFLHGAPGLGKTHLLGAIAHYLERSHPELEVRYTTGERFTSEFVNAVRGAGPQRFKARHRDIDVLLIDDVQFLENKSRTEEEFFHTFDALHESGSQIVLACDRAPRALSKLARRLRDRFEWGLSVELTEPDMPTRLTVLGRLADTTPIEFDSPATLREIAAHCPANVRQLEGALTRVIALASITNRAPTPKLVTEALRDSRHAAPERSSSSRDPDRPSVTAIQDAVCAVLELSREELMSSSRTTAVTRGRHVAMYLARELTALSLADIARSFDRDHSTVLHAVRRIESELRPDSTLHHELNQARAMLSTDPVHMPTPSRRPR